MFTMDQFTAEFFPKLGNTRRWIGFSSIADYLLKRKSFSITEVGCIRVLDNWEGDGQSTRVWNWMLENKGDAPGFIATIDRDQEPLEIAKEVCPLAHTYHGDGITILRSLWTVDKLDLLFLDGMDFTGPHAWNAWLQHISLLGSTWERLPSGCLIAMDDCENDECGKHIMVKAFFDRIGVKPLFQSYMTGWIKP